MARSFNLTAEINLRAPGNLKTVVAEIRRELGTVSANVNLKLDAKSTKSVSAIKSKLDAVNAVLVTARNNTDALNASLQNLSSALTSVGSAGTRGAGSIKVTADSAKSAAENLTVAASGMEEFGKQSFLAVKRFAAFSFVTSGIYGLVNAINSGFAAFIKFDRELVRLQQVTGKSSSELRVLEKVITDLSINLGISSESLTQVAVTLAQAGLTANETKVALAALAKTELAPSFDNLAETTEGAIAVLRQFDLQASDLEAALGSVNAVAAAFAVEADDLIAAIQRTGGVFANASKGVSEGTDALNEFLAIFTSVRQTTRESAETIATGLRTIFTRIQRAKTIDQLREFGIELTDLEGKFVGPFEAVKRLSEGLKTLDPRDIRFSSIVEELGGFRQIGKVIPLIQQFAVAQEALKVAQKGQGSLADAQVIAQKSLANQLAKVREQFLAFIRDVGKSEVFQSLFKIVLNLTSGLISLASAFKPILPILAIVGAIKGVKAVGDFATGFFGATSKGSSRGAGESLGSTISGAKDKERADATAKAAEAIKANTSALNNLTSAVQALTSKIGSAGGSTTLNSGGKVMAFARGGVVPGSGRGDKIPALLEPGEVVINNAAANKYGRENLVRMNKNVMRGKTKKYTWGGKISTLAEIYPSIENAFGYEDISNQTIKDSSKFVPITPNEKQIKEFQGMPGPYGIRFEKILAKYYGLSNYKEKGKWDYLDFPSARAEAKFMSKGDTYDDGDGKGNTTKTIAAKNYLFENSLRSPNKPNTRVTELWPDIQELPSATVYYPKNPKDFFQKLAMGGKIQKFMTGGKALGARSRFKELTPDKLLQLSTEDLIQYARDQATDIFTTGGAGMAIGHEFIEVPQERIVPELESDLVSYMGKKGFWREVVAPFGRQAQSSTRNSSRVDRETALASQVSRYSDEVAARDQQWTSIRDGSPIDKYLLSNLTDPILSDYRTVRSGGSLAKDFHNTRLRQAVNKILESYDDFDYSGSNIDKLVSGMAAKRFAHGGLIQKFSNGAAVESTESISEDILKRIDGLGGPGPIREAVGVDYINQIIKSELSGRAITAKQLLSPKSLRSMTDSSTLLPAITPILEKAETIQKKKDEAKRDQIARNLQAASGGAYQFGLASIYGPNGELGYSSVGNAQEIEGNDGQKYLTQIVRKSLPSRYEGAIKATREDIAGLSQRAGERFQYADIFGTGGPLAFDFDETLVKGADIFTDKGQIDFLGYNDTDKVQKALANAELTLLGKELQKRLSEYPQLMDNIRVLTARPPSNAPYLASTLSRLELPIPQNKITGVSGGLNKVNNLSELETLIDDNLENIQSVIAGGKKAIPYKESKMMDISNLSSYRALAATEGYALEEMVRNWGVNVGSDDDNDPLKPIDFPKGLGVYASKWDMPPNIPTDTKRTNSSTAASIMLDRAKKFYVENFAVGGLADATEEMSGLMKGLYGDRSSENQQPQKKEKQFGKIALRSDGSDITATYFKQGANALLAGAEMRSGQVTASKIDSDLYAVKLSAATKGYGPRLYDVVMEAATENGAMLTSDRNSVSGDAKKVWEYYFNNRGDVKKTPLKPANWTKNQANIDPKLYGNEDTWPPATDSAWILQSGYSKTPSLINDPNSVVKINQKAQDSAQTALQFFQSRPMNLASGGSLNKTVPAMVSSGEAFVPPKIAKKIGYAKLDKMNQADRNGMRGFASGGISVFKGPGSGTSDSIGPIGLPTGSYVIREKATKALGLSSGGSVGSIPAFVSGGTVQDQDYFIIKAKQAGQSLDQFAKSLVYAAKDMAKGLQDAQKTAKVDLKAISIELSDKYRAAGSGSDADDTIRSNIIETISNKIRDINPELDVTSAKNLATQIADRMSSGETFDQLKEGPVAIAELTAVMKKSLTAQEAQTEALKKVAQERGLSPEVIERLLGDRARGGRDNSISRVVDFFGGPLKVTTRSLLLAASAFEEGAKYIYGAEKLSAETRGALGGIRGGAQGAAVVAEMDIEKNISEFGKFLESFGGRLGSAGQALQKFSGALQAGAIAYAAVSGAIKGFYESLNQARLEQELQKLSLATDKTTEAFRRLEKTPTDTNATLAQQALGQEMESMEGLRRTAAVDIQGRRSLETARSWDFTGITSAVSGQNQEKDARKAFFDVSARRFEQFGTLGARRLNEVDPKEIEKAVADANKDDTIITRLAKELEDLQAAPVRDDAAIKAKQGEVDTAQQAKAENLFRKSQRFGQIAALEGEQEALRQFYINQAQTEEEKNQRLKALNGQLGDTDKERSDNQQKAIDTAKRLAAAEAETELRTKLLSDATQKLNLQTENLLRTYSVATAILQRFGESINLIKDSAGATAAALEGRAQIGNIDRTNENILGNIEAYSLEEVRGAAVQTGQLAGGGLGGQNLQNQVLTAKVLQEALPQALATTGSEDVGEVINKLEDAFSQAGVAFSEPIKEDLRNALQSEANKAQGVSFQKLAQESDVVANLLKQTEAGLKAAQEFQKRYNDALAAAIELQNGYAQALQQSIDYQIKASEIRANADIQLKETLGQRVTSADRNAAFDTRIRTLTSTNVIPGGTTDPNQIFQQLMSGVAGQRSQEEELTRRKQEFASDPTEANKARVAEQMQAMAKQNVAINNSRKALEELANDGSKAANALKDLQEIDRVATGATNFTRNVLTSSGEDLAKINKQLLAFTKFRSGNATGRDVNNLQFRQDVFAGGDLIKSVLPKELAEQLDAKLSLDMLRATPGGATALQTVVGRTPPDADGNQQDITLESALNMKAGGRDPVQERYIQAYESATRVQATAAENLGKAAMAVADTFNNKMIEVLTQIQQQLPTILEQSVTAGMTPAVAAAYKEMNVAVKERQALDATQAASMGLDSTGFNAVSTAYDAVETSKKRTEDLVLSQAKAQGFNSVEEFKTKAREKYDTVVGSDQYKASIDAQAAAKANFDTIAAGANLDPAEAFRTMTDYRTSDPYTQATTKIAEKEAAFKAAQAGPQPEKPTGTKPLEVTPADTKAKEEERQKQQAGDDESKLALAFGAHVASFAAAVAAFAVTVAASGGSGLLQRFFGRGGAGTPAVSGGAGVPRPMGAPGSIPGMGAPAAGAPAGAPGAGGGWLSLLGKAVAAAEIGRGAYVGATADTTTNRELTEGWMGETVGTGFNTSTGALTGNTGQSQLATLAGIDENASYAQGAAGNLLGTAEAAGRGAAIGYQFGGPTGALVGAIAGLAGDVTKNGALLVQAIGDVADQTQKNADAEAKNKRMEEGLRTSMNSTNAERFGEDAGAALSKLSPQEQVRAREEANLRVRLQKTEAIASTSGTDAEKLSALGEDTTRWQSIDDLLSFLRNEAATSAQYRANITTEQAGLFTSEKKRGADSPEFLSAVDALVISQEQSADNQAKTAKMADEATKPGSIYTHDIYSQKLLEQLVSLTGSSPVTSNSDSITAPDLAQKLFDPQSIVKQAQGALSGVVSTLSDPSKVVDIGGKALTDGLNMPSNMLKQVPDLMKTLLNPLELSKSITKSISDEDGKKLDINKNIAEGFSLSSLAKLIPSSLLDKLGLSTGAETTNESCECKLLAQILAVLQKCCPGGTSTVTPTSINAPIPAPVPPGVNAVPAIQQPNRPNVVPQVGVQAPAIGPGQVQAAVGLEPKPELALQQAEKAKQETEATKPNISDKPSAPSAPRATMTKAENMRLINLNSKGAARRSEEEENEYQTLRNKQMEANPKLKAEAEKRRRIALASKGSARRSPEEENEYQTLRNQQITLADALQSKDSITSTPIKSTVTPASISIPSTVGLEPRPELALQEASKNQAVSTATQPPVTDQQKTDTKPLAPYEARQKAKRDSYQSQKKSRREAYLSRFRPEVREKMMTDEEKAARKSSSSQSKPAISSQDEASLSPSEKANLAALSRIPKEERSEDQQARYNALNNRNRATNPAIDAKAKAEIAQRQQEMMQAQTANFTTPVQFDDNALTLGQVDAGAATPAQTQAIAQAQIGANQPQATPEQRQAAAAALASSPSIWSGERPVAIQTYGTDPRDIPPQDPNALRLPSQPVPTPLQTNQTPQYTAQTVSADQGASATAQQYTLSLDPASLKAFTQIQTSFTEFGKYVTQLANIKLPNQIEITGGGNYTMEVNITGAAAMEMLQTETKKLAETFVVEEIQKLKDKLNKVFPSEFKASGSGGENVKP